MDVKTERLVGLIHQLTMGGAERMMVNILNHFATEGKDVHLIIFKNIGELKSELHKDIVIHDLESSSVFRGMGKCLKRLQKIKADTVFSGIGFLNLALSPFIPVMKFVLPKTKWVARETNIVSLQRKLEKNPKLFDFLYRRTYHFFDVIIVQSKDMQNDLERNYPKTASKTELINNPIDIKKVQKKAEESINFSFSESKINLISVGEFRKTKRQDWLLKCMTLLPEHYHLVLLGSGKEERKLKLLTKELNLENRVTFEGQQKNPYAYMKRADLFVLTSEHEGFPNVLLEANALGLPVVAFACLGGITEIIEEGVNGFFVPLGNIPVLKLSIEKALNEPFDTKKVITSVEKRFSHNIIMGFYQKIFFN